MSLSVKKNSSKWYFFKSVVGLLFSLLLLYLAIPALVLMFVHYPTLEQATIIEGTLHIKQSPYRHGDRRSLGGIPDPQNYVIDAKGVSHQIFWRIKGDSRGLFDRDFEGLKTKVWFHPWYGVIQGEYEKTPEIIAKFARMFPPERWDKAVGNPEHEVLFKDKFSRKYDKDNALRSIREFHIDGYIWGFLMFLAVLFYTIYCFIKFFRVKKLEKGAENG